MSTVSAARSDALGHGTWDDVGVLERHRAELVLKLAHGSRVAWLSSRRRGADVGDGDDICEAQASRWLERWISAACKPAAAELNVLLSHASSGPRLCTRGAQQSKRKVCVGGGDIDQAFPWG